MYSQDLVVRKDWRYVVRCVTHACTPVSDYVSQALIDENHRLLDQLRVSHPSLEAVRRITSADPYNLVTKLTGAGGGGCAVTLIPEGWCSLSSFLFVSSAPAATFLLNKFLAVTFRTDSRLVQTFPPPS